MKRISAGRSSLIRNRRNGNGIGVAAPREGRRSTIRLRQTSGSECRLLGALRLFDAIGLTVTWPSIERICSRLYDCPSVIGLYAH